MADKDLLLAQTQENPPDDDDIIRLKQLWLDESDDYHNELQIIGEVARQYAKGRQTGYDQLAIYESHAVDNRLFVADESAIPIVTARLPEIQVIPPTYDEVAVQNANKIGDVVKSWMEDNDIQHLSEVSFRSIARNRFFIWNVYYDDEKEQICVRFVPTKNCYFPRYSWKNIPWFIEKQEYNIDDLVEQFGESAIEKVEQAQSSGLLSTIISFFGYSDQSKEKKGKYIVYALWTKKWCAYVGKSEVLYKEKNPYWKEEGEYDDKDGNEVKVTKNSDMKDQAKINHFDFKRIPYIISSAFEDGEETVGITSLYEQGIPMQDVRNKTWRYFVDYMETVGDPIWLIDSSVMTREESEQITSEHGRKYYGKGIANEKLFRRDKPPEMPGYIEKTLENSGNSFDDLYGTHSATSGSNDPQNPTLGQDQISAQADSGRMSIFTRSLGRALNELGDWVIQMVVLYWDEERNIPILSDSDSLGFIEGFSNDLVEKGIKFRTKANTGLPDDKASRANVMMGLAKIGMIRPVDLFRSLGLPDPEGLEDNLVKWKKGQVAPQQTQGAIQSPAGGQPEEQTESAPAPATSTSGGSSQ